MVLGAVLLALGARAQGTPPPGSPVQGWASERLYPSAPGAGWFVMDTLDMHGELGGAVAFTARYAQAPVRVNVGGPTLAVVTDAGYGQVAAAITWRGLRFSLGFDFPVFLAGVPGTVGGFSYAPPTVNLGNNPDTLSDVRIGIDGRFLGTWNGSFRLGFSAQLWIPSGDTADYITDGTYRGMLRLLAAGDSGALTWAAQLGVHLRPRNDPPPGSPRGNELLFGFAAGRAGPLDRSWRWVLGPELYGATAFDGFFGSQTTTAEVLLSGRIEGTGQSGPQLRVKMAGGGGFNTAFGSAAWRVLLSVELFTRNASSNVL